MVQVWGFRVAEIPGITKMLPGQQPWWCLFPLPLLLLPFFLRRRRFVVLPDFVEGMVTAELVREMAAGRWRWIMEESEHEAYEGRVEQVGPPGDIYDRPATPFVAGFVGSANVLHGEVVEGHVHLGSLRLPAAHLDEGAAAAAYVRPHDVVVTAHEDGVSATIERVASLGWLARVSLRLPGGETLVAHVPTEDLGGAGEGDEVRVDLRNPKAFLVPELVETQEEVPA